MTDKRNSTQMDRFKAAFEEAVGNAIHLHDIPTLVAALEMVDMTNGHYAKVQAGEIDIDESKGSVNCGPLNAALTMLGTITRSMIPTTNQTELGLLSADYRKAYKRHTQTDDAEHRNRMRKVDLAMQNIIAKMWVGCK